MIANLFFSLIAAGFAAEAAAKARYERLWSFLLLGILALLGFNFWENGRLGIVETFAFHWIDTSLMRIDVNLNTDAAVYGLAAPFVLLTGISVFYNTFYKAEADKLRLNGLLLLNLAAVILVICAQNFMQLLTAVCIADVLCLFMINDIEGKRRYVFYNLLADMGLFTLFALIWKQTGSISLSALSGYHQPGQYPELTVGLLLFCAFIKSGMFLFQGGFLNLAGLSFNRIFSVSYCATPLIGILLLIKAYPLLGNVAYAPVALELFGGLTLLWAFVGAISIDNLKDKALYFNLMFYALMVGLLSLGLNPLLKLLPGLLLAGSLLNILWMMTAVSASNELFVSNMGDFAVREKRFLCLHCADVCFGSGNNRGGRAAKRTVGLRLCGRIVDGAGTCFVSDIFGKDECGRAGLGFSEKSAAALSVSCCCGRRLHDLAERILLPASGMFMRPFCWFCFPARCAGSGGFMIRKLFRRPIGLTICMKRCWLRRLKFSAAFCG